MDKEKILEGMSYVDPELVAAADEPCHRSGRAWRRPVLIAASLCLVLAGTAMAVSARLNWSFGQGFQLGDGRDVAGTVEVWSPEALPVESLSQEARDLAEAAGPEVEVFKGFMSDEMGTVRTEIDEETGFRVTSAAPAGMDAWDQMERFLGVDILPDNPVLRSAITGILYVDDEEACRCALYLYNGADGELYSVNTYGCFNTSYDPAADRTTVMIDIHTNARTDRNPYDNGGGVVTFFMTEEEQARSTQEEHVTPSGLECLLTSTDQGWEAYFCYGASVVHLSATGVGDGVDDEAVRAELIRVLDAFE